MRASTPAVTFESGGVSLAGLLHLPAGPGPHPVVLLLQGFPGNERSLDLAQALRSAGYAAVAFHYRGSWGMGGTWSWGNLLEDAAAVARAVRAEPFASAHRLDPGRLALFGHSAGGFAALMTAAADPSIAAVVSVSAFDFGTVARSLTPESRARYVEAFGEDLLPLRGTSGEALVAEMERAGERWSLAGLAPRLAGRPVLLIGTSDDPVTPAAVHHRPLVTAYPEAEQHEWHTDHALSDHRQRLVGTVRKFLDGHL
ncbi:alpha/beta hydrolase family protein [Nonomuraea rubra]|uniref:Dipeptidyl aminopeptidase/acylaminoacyl peptidase n=1 Tax=Nonomuraea rubra TaxID=46180 RepID=A0A7X0P2N8_9ACTN|nr:alpha/beta fold hydrolase [Nonomuraea rubra]MBB6554133.1 dipeptidyl aminopeptidase/acylaminoacyl peptidase [Nonomuraea rubra]